jgi:hypothetical protein
MKKLAVLLLLGAVIVAISASDAMAYRYLGGSYTYAHGPYGAGGPWYGDAGNGPHAYTAESSNAMADGTVTVTPTNQTFDANPAQVSFADVTDNDNTDGETYKSYPGGTEAWWANISNTDRQDLVKLDLGQEVEMDAIVTIHNMRHGYPLGVRGYDIFGSHDGVTWQEVLTDGEQRPEGYWWPRQSQGEASPLGEKYNDVFVRPAFRPIGLFLNPATGLYDLDTVTYRYLRFDIGANGSDSTAVSEIIIDAVPEPATMLMLVGGGLLGLLRRKS